MYVILVYDICLEGNGARRLSRKIWKQKLLSGNKNRNIMGCK